MYISESLESDEDAADLRVKTAQTAKGVELNGCVRERFCDLIRKGISSVPVEAVADAHLA